jgi:DNA polymerase-3 subunit alpha
MERDELLKLLDEYGVVPETITIKKSYAKIRGPHEKAFVYFSKYKLKATDEINIPVFLYELFTKKKNNIIFVIKDNKLHLLNRSKVPETIRFNKKLKMVIYQIPNEALKEFPKKTSVKHQSKPFVHLHCHSEYSILDGVSKCFSLLKRASEFGMPALAVTDHGNASAHMDLLTKSKGTGVHPIFGSEFYLTDDASKKDGDHRSNNHLVLLTKDEEGYENLLYLQMYSWHPDHFYYRPRIDIPTLKTHNKGLVALTACLKGWVASEVLDGRYNRAKKKLKQLKNIFGKDLYAEIQLHNIYNGDGKDIQRIYNEKLIKLAKELNVELVLTNDVHYLDKGMEKIQAKVIKMKTDSDLAEAYCNSIWFKSYDDLKETWKSNCSYIDKKDFMRAVNNTITIAEKCKYIIPTGELRIPTISLKGFPKYKKGMSEEEYLRLRIRKGLAKKKEKGELVGNIKDYLERIEVEIDAFNKMRVISYILIYDDLVRYLKKQGCLCSLRGSANGSLCLWLIGMSFIDPIRFGILFERFISPARIAAQMADIDIDLDIVHTYRPMAIEYLKKKYGEDHICPVGSFGRTQLKAAIKSMARVEAMTIKKKIDATDDEDEKAKLYKKLEPFSYQKINEITRIMKNETIDELKESKIAEWYEENRRWLEEYIIPIIGNTYSESLHPAGVVISPEPYYEWLPVRTTKVDKNKGGGRVYSTQWENSHTFEEFLNERGVMVMDILGVKTLTIINNTFKLIKKKNKKKFSLSSMPLDDKKVYKSIATGENLGLFQLNAEFMKNVLRNIKPDCIEDIIFLVSADRPGPMASGAFEHYADRKHGKEEVDYMHPSLKPVLENSMGVLVYSEQIMRAATLFAGMDPIDSEKMRKIIKAKNPADFLAFKDKFIDGVVKKWTKKGE